jgi:hypothetical protein
MVAHAPAASRGTANCIIQEKSQEKNGKSTIGKSTDPAGYLFYGGAERDRTADLLVANWLNYET